MRNLKKPYVIQEAALIFESGADQYLDYVIVVHAKEKTRVDRVMRRDGKSRDEVEARMVHQMDPEKKKQLADLLLEV